MTRIRSNVLIGLGGNLSSNAGEPAQTLLSAIKYMPNEGLKVHAVSRFFTTPCFPAGAGPDYVNAALSVYSTLKPEGLLAALHRIEHRFGRIRDQRWGMRTLDLDLLAVGQNVLPDAATYQAWHALPPSDQARAAPDRLVVPHPRLQDRAFVLVPLADIAPDWVHPVLGQSVASLCAQLPPEELAGVCPI
jgi:2-amino-4-hydroxy-6-hydroxymethyldihydropteridine diphosphokinase